MNNIDIFTNYKVIEEIKDIYKTYDSDADDYFKTDYYINKYELDGPNLLNKIFEKIKHDDFINITFDTRVKDTFRIKIETFEASDGTGCGYEYFIKKLNKTWERE